MQDTDYHVLLDAEKDNALPNHGQIQKKSWSQSKILWTLLIILGMLAMLVSGFLLGVAKDRIFHPQQFVPDGNKHYFMHFNGSFPNSKSPESDALWNKLIPKNNGFIEHPTLAPNVGGFAVFHELHCLDILRQGFFAALDGKLKQLNVSTVDRFHRLDTEHMRHCFEYLRQSIICLADSNIENINHTTRTVTGWETERTCRDFDGLFAFATEWAASG